MPKCIIILALVAASFQLGCTQVVVRKSPCEKDKGIRYWRPKPYLFIGPAGSEQQESTKPKEPADHALAPGQPNPPDQSPQVEVSNFTKISMSIKYLPDYNEEYSIRMTPGLGIGKLDLALQDGWNLTTVGIQQDQQTAAILTSVAGLISAVRGGTPAAASRGETKAFVPEGGEVTQYFDASRDVPLGFYEPVIATDPYGHKSLFGWRYVGFMPFAGCPVDPYLTSDTICCNSSELWGIYATSNALRFQRLSEMQDGVIGYSVDDKRKVYNSFKVPKDGVVTPAPHTSADKDETSAEHQELLPPLPVPSENTSSTLWDRAIRKISYKR